MKRTFFFCLTGTLFVLYPISSLAKSVWLECGKYIFNLNEDTKTYSTTLEGKLIQGNAVFFPSQINFEVPLYSSKGGGGIRYDFSINRKTLDYQKKVMSRVVIATSFAYKDTGWVQQNGDHSLTNGTCKIIKNPTEGNKI